jgi:hypothetical protein
MKINQKLMRGVDTMRSKAKNEVRVDEKTAKKARKKKHRCRKLFLLFAGIGAVVGAKKVLDKNAAQGEKPESK